LVVCGKGVSGRGSERRRGEIGGGHVVSSAGGVGSSRIEGESVMIHRSCFLSL
jgi:hypothetical protein